MSLTEDERAAYDSLPARDDWKKAYGLDSGIIGFPTAHVIPCAVCAAMILADRNAIERHAEWHQNGMYQSSSD